MPALYALLDVDLFYQIILMFYSIKHQQCCFSTSILLNLFKAMKTKTWYKFEFLFQYNQFRWANQCHWIRFKFFFGISEYLCSYKNTCDFNNIDSNIVQKTFITNQYGTMFFIGARTSICTTSLSNLKFSGRICGEGVILIGLPCST